MIRFYTENKNFLVENTLEQEPLYTVQTHMVYTFDKGFWVSASLGYAYGGKSVVNGEKKNDLKENLAWAVSLGYPITCLVGVKVFYLGTRTARDVDQDADQVAVSFSFLW